MEQVITNKAIITILGKAGELDNHTKAKYYFEWKKEVQKEYFNTFPLLIENFSKRYEIVPIYTKDAQNANIKVLKKENLEFNSFNSNCLIHDDKDFKNIFKIINETIASYEEVIVDVSHGFRHLPILMIVDLIIQNFQDTQKIKKILFAKEIQAFKEYEIIDLKEYLELANISFVLTTFEKNYTVASHIKSVKYSKLLKELNDFSNDLMALNIGNLLKTSKELIEELDKIDDISIKTQAETLKLVIQQLTDFKNKKRYLVYYQLSKNLFEKEYMLLSLALLYESIRMYIKSYIKNKYIDLVEDIELQLNYDLYKIGSFFKNLSWRNYSQFQNQNKTNLNIIESDYIKLANSYPKHLNQLYSDIDKKRNNLAHANSNGKFEDIKKSIKELIINYEKLAINRGI
ncbi:MULTISPECIES: TM1812 family CRISPR-associated protein [Aliarcobacter]|uniref:TM1812 family CRISPR-associated protein n=1 Tax=Arcobacter sp. AZ-2023 TaxID=3074453 RepID=A0AA96DLY4_9BACT|nr:MULTISPECIES: TM1812 family CRISPR-associated protein [Aliarcobacter]WNL30474.1 TM1812 family CRISPR-associated protein [Arcobacter sp. AZ-2023]MCT7486166.1 TM1812 family CRISPR-associated protein [Aliarcobacter cryaerophilus]MCT7491644.1 TM1812 family CRISPR-associated protein [Aliarcobacter cryaerophilus]MCT7597226.1 TM1812 family CRISPR-associated protein [Aliarcobacter butzleri]MDK2063489.1 TM1812 family CRISPR-associated protein [Aliarcobacter butzleri]